MVSPTSEVLHGEIQDNAQSTQAGKTAQVKHEEECANSIALKRRDLQARPLLGLLRSKGGTTIAAISKATGWQPNSVRGFFAGVVRKKLGLTLESEKTKYGRIYRIVRATTSTSAPSPSASGTAEQGDA